jgi:hypothetical protein
LLPSLIRGGLGRGFPIISFLQSRLVLLAQLLRLAQVLLPERLR